MSSETKSARILARTFFNQLQSSGYTPRQVVGVATELLDLVAARLREDRPSGGANGGGGDTIEHARVHAPESQLLDAPTNGHAKGQGNGHANGQSKRRASGRAPISEANGVSAD